MYPSMVLGPTNAKDNRPMPKSTLKLRSMGCSFLGRSLESELMMCSFNCCYFCEPKIRFSHDPLEGSALLCWVDALAEEILGLPALH